MLSEDLRKEAEKRINDLINYIKDCNEPIDSIAMEVSVHISAALVSRIEDPIAATESIPVLAQTFRMVYQCGFLKGKEAARREITRESN